MPDTLKSAVQASLTARNIGLAIDGRVLLDDVSVTVEPGTVVGLVGRNGSGKSTLLKVIARQMANDRGSVELDGEPAHHTGHRDFARRVGYLQQHLPPTDGMSVAELVACGRYPWHGATGRFVVAAGGNVGIGTLDPLAPLHVNQAVETGSDIFVTSPEFARMRLAATAPEPDVTLSIQARASSDAFTFAEIGTVSRHALRFYTNGNYHMTINDVGNVGIGTTEPSPLFRLSVNGGMRAKEVVVETGWSDFVFEEGYELLSLQQVEAFIARHGHLPDIPSAAEVAANGVNLGEMDAKLLQKIEELTLHLIALEKRLMQLEAENIALRTMSAGPPAAASLQGGR